MLLYAVTIFVSAFLLFLVQPVMAKQILPWFGGSAAVWTTCLVFFQIALLAGYAYSDYSVRRLGARAQVKLHTLLLVVSLVVLPIVPGAQWKPSGAENPSWLILGMLAATIGLPYFLLSTTSPLVQAWFARARPGVSPYRLFALSNLASMLALVGYPFLLEPWAPTREQALGWSVLYALFVGLCAAAGWVSVRRMPAPAVRTSPTAGTSAVGTDLGEPPPTAARQVLWCTLAATGSVLLLAVSNHITQNVASVPLLWIVPLALYLLTFILCFDSSGWYRREIFLAMTAASLGVMAWTLADPSLTHELEIQIGVFCGGLFLGCMFCHGELVRLKPAPRFLTRFYLMISLGGAAGSVVVGIVAPLVLPAYFELAAGLVLCALLLLWQVRREPPVFGVLALVALLVATGCGGWGIKEFYDNTIVATRNFYGVLRVQEHGRNDPSLHRNLIHGTIMHGKQYLAPDFRRRPTSYYTATSGIGRVLEALHPRLDPIRVGVIGLGAGTLAVYGSKGDTYRFYDINPDVLTVAQRDFTYLGDSDATIELPLGDARLNLEREPSQQFDVLAIDAFSSDAIPVHLITSEALGVYLRHMKKGGIIAFHLTNRFLNLVPVVDALAKARGLEAILISDEGEEGSFASRSDWMLLTDGSPLFAKPELADHAAEITSQPDWRLWTDDFNNLVQVLK
ncbi:MAG: fused MFS/spermidine synthase [Betaproteobacteria bacterium]